MSTKVQLLQLLGEKENKYVSGQEIADTLGLSRNAIWKAVKSLQNQGFAIESSPGVGYRLTSQVDLLSPPIIQDSLNFPCRVHVLDTVDSTNHYAKSLPPSDIPQLIIANEQTAGRGRLGRTFFSPLGSGLYMTFAFCPQFSLDKAMLVTTLTSVAVCRAMEKVSGLRPKIKWVNDLYLNEKKVCGILTEAESNFETGAINRLIIGIGINCMYSQFPEDLENIATYMKDPLHPFTRNQLAAEITNQLFCMLSDPSSPDIMRDYRLRSFILGKQIQIFNPSIAKKSGKPESRLHEGVRARAIDIDQQGGLVIEYLEGRYSHQMETLTTGEITIRKETI